MTEMTKTMKKAKEQPDQQEYIYKARTKIHEEITNGKRSGKIVLANYTTSNLALKNGKALTSVTVNMRLGGVGSVLDTLN